MRKNPLQVCFVTVAATILASGQTQVDLRSQSKSINFSAAQATTPLQVGSSLPQTCSVGQMFFLASAPAGQNLYGCVTDGVWALESPVAPVGSGGAAQTIVKASGTTVGSRSTVDLYSGPGVIFGISDTGQEISVQTSLDTSVVQTRADQQAGTALLCVSPVGSASAYSCALSPTLAAYRNGMVLYWQPGISGAGGATTLNIDTLGAKPLVKADGLTNTASGEIVAGRLYPVWYDGSVFRILSSGAAGDSGTGTASPASPGIAGAAPFASFQGATAAITQTGSDVTLYSVAVPALAAGGCYRMFLSESDTGGANLTLKVYVDATLIATPYNGGNSPPTRNNLLYCNQPGVQNAQQLAYTTPMFYSGNATIYSNVDAAVGIPAAVDWSTGHTITFKTNGTAAATVTGEGFAVYQ